MWVVGLGNPGPRYAATRHNVGQRVVLDLVDRWGACSLARARSFKAYRALLGGREVDLIAPLAFMNRSGEALTAFERVEGVAMMPAEILIVCDDVYLPVGTLRLRARGSTGGHLGLASIEKHLGTPDYPRLRIGVGKNSSEELSEHVLSSFEMTEIEPLEDALQRAQEAVEVWLEKGTESAMNFFNRRSKEVDA